MESCQVDFPTNDDTGLLVRTTIGGSCFINFSTAALHLAIAILITLDYMLLQNIVLKSTFAII